MMTAADSYSVRLRSLFWVTRVLVDLVKFGIVASLIGRAFSSNSALIGFLALLAALTSLLESYHSEVRATNQISIMDGLLEFRSVTGIRQIEAAKLRVRHRLLDPGANFLVWEDGSMSITTYSQFDGISALLIRAAEAGAVVEV